MMKSTAIVLAVLALGVATPGQAASRLGGQTDDSVCDLGTTHKMTKGAPSPSEFVQTRCKNGQMLMGISVVSASGSDSEIVILAKSLCRIADIQARRFRDTAAASIGATVDLDEVRCKIEKLTQ